MTYIGGTLYAPTGFDHEGFKIIFEQLAQTGLEIDEPSAIGRGADTVDSNSVRLLIKSAFIEDYVLTTLESSLEALYPEITLTIEAVGDEPILPRGDLSASSSEVVATVAQAREDAVERRRLQAEQEAHDRELRSMTTEQLRAAGYYEAAQKREEEEAALYSDPEGMF